MLIYAKTLGNLFDFVSQIVRFSEDEDVDSVRDWLCRSKSLTSTFSSGIIANISANILKEGGNFAAGHSIKQTEHPICFTFFDYSGNDVHLAAEILIIVR